MILLPPNRNKSTHKKNPGRGLSIVSADNSPSRNEWSLAAERQFFSLIRISNITSDLLQIIPQRRVPKKKPLWDAPLVECSPVLLLPVSTTPTKLRHIHWLVVLCFGCVILLWNVLVMYLSPPKHSFLDILSSSPASLTSNPNFYLKCLQYQKADKKLTRSTTIKRTKRVRRPKKQKRLRRLRRL